MNTNPEARRILCYGDSNTKGLTPFSYEQFPINISWPGILQDKLGSNYEIISEGLAGRTIVVEEVSKPFKTGITHLKAILRSHMPLDMIIIMLGTNDIKDRYNLNASQIAQHLNEFILYTKDVIKNPETKIMIICPPAVVVPDDAKLKDKLSSGPEKFKELPKLYKEVSEKSDCLYIDAGEHISLKNTDGYHLDKDGHKSLAKIVSDKIKEISITK